MEKLAADLKQGNYANDAEKLELWEQMKIQSLARLLSASYGYSLLVVCLKAQMSILSSTIYLRSQIERQKSGTLTRSINSASGILDDIMARWSGGDANLTNTNRRSTPEDQILDQQLFLQCIQYFIVHGIDHLMEKIELLVRKLCGDISLKDDFSIERSRGVLEEARRLLETGDCRNFSYFIVPITANLDVFASHSEQLQELLHELKGILESETCRKLLFAFGGRFSEKILEFLKNTTATAGSDVLPMAKVVPIFADCFEVLSSLEFGSVVQNILCSPELHEFCLAIFNGRLEEL